MTKAEKEKLFRKLKAFMKNNFYLQNTWGEYYGVYFDYDYLKYNGPVAQNNSDKKKNKKAVWDTLFNDLKKVIDELN